MSFLDRLRLVLGGSGPGRQPTSAEVAGRAYALNAVIVYAKTVAASGVMPSQLPTMTREQASAVVNTAATVAAKVLGAAKKFGFSRAFSPAEAALLNTSFDKLDDQRLRDATWRTEAWQLILWALGKLEEIPSLDVQAGDDLLHLLHLEQFEQFAASARLRDTATIEKAREVAELWHWRSRTRQCIEENQPFPEIPAKPGAPRLKTFDDVVRLTAKGIGEAGMAALETIEEDFKVRGKAFRTLTAAEWAEVGSIIVERHFALNWLCGRAPGNRWDETPTGT